MRPAPRTPPLASDFAVSADAVGAYRRDGHVHVAGLASAAEVGYFRPHIRAATLRWRSDRRPLEERDTYGRAFIQTMNLWRRDAVVAAFATARRFARVAADLMGVDAVRMYHDQALFKEPGGGHTPWHQDRTYWPLETDHTITLWMALVDIPEAVGSMRFVSGSHRSRDLGVPAISDATEQRFDALIAARGWTVATHGAMRAGDATFHDGWVLHGAGPNPTAHTREVMTVIYFADGARVAEPRYPGQAQDLRVWLPGCDVGDLAASELNPVLFARGD